MKAIKCKNTYIPFYKYSGVEVKTDIEWKDSKEVQLLNVFFVKGRKARK